MTKSSVDSGEQATPTMRTHTVHVSIPVLLRKVQFIS